MLRALGLVLPVVFPSWRFFDTIGPSPRIEVARLSAPEAAAQDWIALTPRPVRRTWIEVLARLFWNPRANADLYLTRCAERVLEDEAETAQKDLIAGAAARLHASVSSRPSTGLREQGRRRAGTDRRSHAPAAIAPAVGPVSAHHRSALQRARDDTEGATAALRDHEGGVVNQGWFRLRILTTAREGDALVTREAFRSAALPLLGPAP